MAFSASDLLPLMDATLAARGPEYLLILQGLLPKGIRHCPPHPPFFTGYQHETLYDWDQYFEAIQLGYCGYPAVYVRNGLRLFLSLQEKDGFTPRSFNPGRGVYFKHNVMFKPFLAQMALVAVHQDGDMAWLSRDSIYEKLALFYRCWTSRFDVRGKGLAVWYDCEHTGMDNHEERAGSWGGDNQFCEGVDLNSYLVREGEALAVLAEGLGRTGDAREFRAIAARIKAAIQEWLWDESEGFFFDRNAKTGEPIRVKYAGAFAALWAGIPTQSQAEQVVRGHLLNETEFWRPYPIPALAATEPGYSEGYLPGESTGRCTWRANTWMPVNYYTFQGLRAYGYSELATELAVKSFRLFDRGRFSEYYTSESGVGTGLKPFWGWSSLAIFMPLECLRHADPTRIAAENRSIADIRAWLQGM